MKYSVVVETRHNARIEKTIRNYGMSFDHTLGDKKVYYGHLKERDYNKLLTFCQYNRVKCYTQGSFSERSSGYRKAFFKANRPYINNRYVCAYCGRLVKKDKLTIDHLYPVNKAKRSTYIQKKLKSQGLSGINDVRNLVPACRKCNQRKSDKMGVWILKGKIGRHSDIRLTIRYTKLVFLIIIIIYTAFFICGSIGGIKPWS